MAGLLGEAHPAHPAPDGLRKRRPRDRKNTSIQTVLADA